MKRMSLATLVENFERMIIRNTLDGCGWNQSEAARQLQVHLATLNQKIKRLGITRTGGDNADAGIQ